MISFECQSCGKKLQVKDEYGGHEGKCPACGRTMQIPGSTTAAAVETEARPRRQLQETNPDDFDTGSPPPSNRSDEERPTRRASRQKEVEPEPPAEAEESEEIKNHGGGDLSPKDDFFAPPPEEIGPILSAYTSLKKDVQPMSPGARLTGIIIAGVVGLVIGIIIALNIKNTGLKVLIPLGLAGIGILIVFFTTGFSHNCTYVGKEGLARFKCKGSRDQISEEVFLFSQASELRTSQTRHYTNSVYQHTDYNYSWTDVGGRQVFAIWGQHKSEQGTPAAKDKYHFATAAERAWTFYKLDDELPKIKMDAPIFFGLGGKNWVKLSTRHITLFFGGQTIECDADDIAEVRIDQGQVQVRRKDAKEGWFSSTGIFKFPYGSLANAHLFLILMDKLVEVPIN